MHKNLVFTWLAFGLLCGLRVMTVHAGDGSIIGKWKVSAETSAGPRELEFEFKQEGEKLTGTFSVPEFTGTFSMVKFSAPDLTAELAIADGTFKLSAILKDGKLTGTYEQADGDEKGTWTAVQVARTASPSEAASPAAGISGTWDSLAVTPGGDMTAALELKQETDKVTGQISSDMGSLPILAASFKDNTLQFDLDLGGNLYRVKAELKDGKLVGGWSPAEGGEGGSWSASRRASAAPPAAPVPGTPAIAGSWDAMASSPMGELRFVVEIKQSGETLSCTITTPDGSIPTQKPAFANDRLTFEVEYMGGNYRIEGALANDKITGKWSSLDGTESGPFTAERKK